MRAQPAAASVLCLCLLMAASAAAAAEGLGKGQQTFPSRFALSFWRCREGLRRSAGWGCWGRAGAALSRCPTRLGEIWPLGTLARFPSARPAPPRGVAVVSGSAPFGLHPAWSCSGRVALKADVRCRAAVNALRLHCRALLARTEDCPCFVVVVFE